MTKPKLFAAGGAHIDRRGRLGGPYIPGASNPGTMREEAGGGVFNALRNAVGHGCCGMLLSVRGGDTAGEAVARAIREACIADLSATFLDRATPSYTAFVEANGDVIAGLADMGLYDLAFAKLIRRRAVRDAIAGADAVLCDANLPEPALERLAGLAGARPIFAVAISPAKAVRLRPVLARIACLFMNRREAAMLSGDSVDGDPAEMARTLAASGLASGVISAGKESILGFDAAGLFEIEPPSPRRMADTTGAGDALAGATVAALMHGEELRQAVREGLAAALLTVETNAAVAEYDKAAFAEALALVPMAHDMG
ncbi:MAG: carbohydrate kinase family protein [Hyphomicrobiales bacterium]|nr:carbohydrate kinase family protein [Hyphomicrobiales bacterium]